ncbi:hypothetical protein [Periweissella beninensis]|uniref:hypothetical protein n=1 Tax=Periweissella beninensis TaxID=504936 RepID=UPI0021A58E12|nr:hypothetical protein [Periweissella beninensis]MCT4395661.1 hypothetical protein [Periweissella beninensis]
MRVGSVGSVKQTIKQKQRLGKVKQHTSKSKFIPSEFSDFMRVRWYLTQQAKLSGIAWAVGEHYLMHVIQVLLKKQQTAQTPIKLIDIFTAAMPINGQLTWQYYQCLLKILPQLQKFLAKELQANKQFIVTQLPTLDEHNKLIAHGVANNLSTAQGKSGALGQQYYDLIWTEKHINWQLVNELYRGIEVLGQIKGLKDITPKILTDETTSKIKAVNSVQGQQILLALLPFVDKTTSNWDLAMFVEVLKTESFSATWTADVRQLMGLSNEIRIFIENNQAKQLRFAATDWQLLEEVIEQVGLNKFLLTSVKHD